MDERPKSVPFRRIYEPFVQECKFNSDVNKLLEISLGVLYAEEPRIKLSLKVLRFRKWKEGRGWPVSIPGILSFLPLLHSLSKADTATVRFLGVSQQTSPRELA